jgi:hypothetical protein
MPSKARFPLTFTLLLLTFALRMHPFLPVTSLVFLLIADGVMIFVRLYGRQPEFATHTAPLYAIILVSLIFGGGLAFWLRRFGLRFPSWVAVCSLLLFAALRLF